jgi:hypothetical protein
VNFIGTNFSPTGNLPQTAKIHFALHRCNEEVQMNTLLDVVSVRAHPGYRLRLEFENGECRLFDMSPYMDKKPFNRLKDSPIFNCAYIDYGTVVWPGNIDIDPETLYECSVPLDVASSAA